MLKKVMIIANRTAGMGRAQEALYTAGRTLWGWPLEFQLPTSTHEFLSLCGKLDSRFYEAAVIVGGDGTVHQALRGLVKSQVPLCVFPVGTANDLANELSISADWECVQWLLDHECKEKMDLITANDIPFATVAGIGVGTVLTSEFNRRRENSRLFREVAKVFQSEIYTLLTVKTILTSWNYSHNLRIKAPSFDERIKTAAVFICNQSHLGGNLQVAPPIHNNDERFNVLIIPRLKTYSLIAGLVQMKKGNLPKDFILFSTDWLKVIDSNRRSIRVFGDGEVLADCKELDFKILPQALQVYRNKKGTQTKVAQVSL